MQLDLSLDAKAVGQPRPSQTKRFAGRRAVVTGSSRGIGAGVAERLAAEGARVVLTGRTLHERDELAGSLEEVGARLARYGTQVEVVVADLADEKSRSEIVPRAEELLGGPVDILVNNAAAAIYQPLAEYPLRRRRVSFEVNVHAPLDLVQAVLPGMREAGEGWIVNVSSATARHRQGPPFELAPPGTAMTVYGSSKAALNRITNGLGAELAGTGIRVNTIEPKFGVLTEGADALVGDIVDPSRWESMEQMVEATVALGACQEDVTGQVTVSLELIEAWGLQVCGLDGQPLAAV